jgi:predicted DNA-binding protein (MmcQ/YjbR family)
MTRQELCDFCLSLPQTDSAFPFDETTELFRVAGKMFALCDTNAGTGGAPGTVNLKCDPDLAAELRREFAEVRPGYHMNKTHWNTVTFNGGIPDDKIYWMIRHSYDCVVAGLPKSKRPALG